MTRRPAAAVERRPLMSTEDLAQYLNVPVATIYKWRHQRKGPPGAKIGREVRYDPDGVDKWWADQLLAAS